MDARAWRRRTGVLLMHMPFDGHQLHMPFFKQRSLPRMVHLSATS